jgi:predicted phage terminase large subunit-like protein
LTLVDPNIDKIIEEKLNRLDLMEARERYEGSLSEFVKGAWSSIDSSEYKSCWALDAFCDHLEAVSFGHIPRLLANYPPRAAKTTIASICWPAWTWARSDKSFLSGPQVRFLCGSYNHDLSLANSNKTRRLIQSPWYQKHWGDRFKLREDMNTKAVFENTCGGSRIATSVGGSLLGIGGDLLVIDDPHNTNEAESEADRLKVLNWWRELHSTRLNDPKLGAIVVVMQRLHVEDVSGVILSSDEEWCHLCLPMRFEENRRSVTVVLPQWRYHHDEEGRPLLPQEITPWEDPREDGELMWPERFGEAEVRRIEEGLTPYMASGRLQQRPSPKGGGIIKRDWWQLWDHNAARSYGLEWGGPGQHKDYPEFELVVGSLDTAFGEKEENDYSAMTVWGIWIDRNKNRRAMLVYAWKKRLPLHGQEISAYEGEAKINFRQRQEAAWGLVELVADTCKRYKVRRLLIEDKTRGRDVAQEINRLYAREQWGVELLNPVKDKVTRAHSVVPLFTDGVVWAPNMRWAEMVIIEAEDFPKAPHDDLVDSVSQFLIWARENEILIRADEGEALLRDEMTWRPRTESIASLYNV